MSKKPTRCIYLQKNASAFGKKEKKSPHPGMDAGFLFLVLQKVDRDDIDAFFGFLRVAMTC